MTLHRADRSQSIVRILPLVAGRIEIVLRKASIPDLRIEFLDRKDMLLGHGHPMSDSIEKPIRRLRHPQTYALTRRATRSLALRERELRSTSASWLEPVASDNLQSWIVTKCVLYKPIFERMKTDDQQRSTSFKQSGRRCNARSRIPSSSFNAMRSAWNVRVAGSMRPCFLPGTTAINQLA